MVAHEEQNYEKKIAIASCITISSIVKQDVLKANEEDWIDIVSGLQNEESSGEIEMLREKLHDILYDEATIIDVNTLDLDENDLTGSTDYDKFIRNERLVNSIESLITVKTGASLDEKQIKEAFRQAEELMKDKTEEEIFNLTRRPAVLRLALEEAKEILVLRKGCIYQCRWVAGIKPQGCHDC